MPIPAFDSNGVIPPKLSDTGFDRSPYLADMVEVVEHFGTTSDRVRLLRGLLDYRAMLTGIGYANGIQLLNGSFVEDIEAMEGRSPKDIDVFSFLERPNKYKADSALWAGAGMAEWRDIVVNNAENRRKFGLDVYGLGDDDMNIQSLIGRSMYWYSLFSHRRVTNLWKGFVAVYLDGAADSTALSTLDRIEDDIRRKRAGHA